MFTRRQLLASLLPAAMTTKKGKQVGWANQLTDPLVFPPGATGGGVISIGSKIPIGLRNLGYTAAIIWTASDGSYIAMAGTGNQVAFFYGISAADPAPSSIAGFIPPALDGAIAMNVNGDILLTGSGSQVLPLQNFFPFQAANFGARFVNFGTGYTASGYRWESNGYVTLEGLTFNNSGAPAVVNDIVVTNLPTPTSNLLQQFDAITIVGGVPTPIILELVPTGAHPNLFIKVGSVQAGQNILLNKIRYYAGRAST